MTGRTSALEALDDFFRTIRAQAERDPSFAATLVRSLSIPIQLEMDPKQLSKTLPYIDPVIIAGQGIDEFRRVFRPISDADLRKLIVEFNIASKDSIPAKGGPKGDALVEMLWRGASAVRKKLER